MLFRGVRAQEFAYRMGRGTTIRICKGRQTENVPMSRLLEDLHWRLLGNVAARRDSARRFFYRSVEPGPLARKAASRSAALQRGYLSLRHVLLACQRAGNGRGEIR